MTIVVQCPHCETRFNLQPDLAGKSMRCPNLDCRQVFTVRELLPRAIDPPTPLPPDPTPEEIEHAPAPNKNGSRSANSQKVKKPLKPQVRSAASKPAEVEFEVLEPSEDRTGPDVKEVVWSAGTNVPPSKPAKRTRPAKSKAADDLPIIRRRKKKSSLAPKILIGLVVALVLTSGFIVFYLMRVSDQNEEKEAGLAEAAYKKGEFTSASKAYQELATRFDGENKPKYEFYAELAAMKSVVMGLTVRDEPKAALEKMESFIKAQKESPFAKHTTGRGSDILEAGRKLGEDVVAHAKDRFKAYTDDRSGKAGELERCIKAVASGRALLKMLEPFRSPDDVPLDEIAKGLDQVEADIKRDRERTTALTKASNDLKDLSDARIQLVEAELGAAGLGSDPDALAMLAAAKGKLRDLVAYVVDPSLPIEFPSSAAATLLFVSPIGKTKEQPAEPLSTIFLTVARGILTAIDENKGTMNWSVRVGPEVTDLPAIARIDLPEKGPTDIAVVTSHVGGQPALAGYDLRTGQGLWYQPLAAPPAGRPAVVGTRAFVSVRDSIGTIYEFDLVTGTRKGYIRLAQPAGPGAVVRPGTGLLYVAADARRIYVIDVSIRDDEGMLKPPQCVQVIATGHAAGTIRTPPLMLGPDGDSQADRWMIVSQAEGPSSMRIRAYAVLPIQPPAADGKLPAETTAASVADLTLHGWAWFPPATDGERLAVVTDAGQMRLFEVRQPGNLDRVLFSLPEPRLAAPPDGIPVRGLIFPGEEAAFWVLSNGTLQKYRLGLIPSRGIEMLPVGQPIPLGEATQMPQTNARKDAVCLVVRSQNSDGCKAVLLNLRDGSFIWQRQLGVVPATSPIPQEDGLLLVAKDGGMFKIPRALPETKKASTVVPAEWLIAAPPESVTSATVVAVSADGKTAYTVTPTVVTEDLKSIPKYLIRKVVDGKLVHEGTVNAPILPTGAAAPLAGLPVVHGASLMLPAGDGIVYRHLPGTGKNNPDTLVAGPQWTGDPRSDSSIRCYITPLPEGAFLTSDGTKRLARWDWPAEGRWNPAGGMELSEQPAGAGLLIPSAAGAPPRLLVADASGKLWLFPNDRGGQPLRRWRPGVGGIPAGRPTSPLVMQMDAMGKPMVAYSVDDRSVVCIDPDNDLPRLAVKTGEEVEGILVGSPQAVGGGRWAITDLGGKVTIYDTASGKSLGSTSIGLAGAVPATAGTPLNGKELLVPLLDGSAIVLPLPTAPEPGPEPKVRQ